MRNSGSFVISASALFGAGLLIVAPVRAQNESVKAVFEKHDLLGMFAYDCGKPVSKQNWYFVDRALDEGHVQRDAMTGQSNREWVAIIDKASELSSGELSIGGNRNGLPMESVWRLESKRTRTEQTILGDKKLIADSKFTGNGNDTPWVYKCDTPGAGAIFTAMPSATPSQEASVKALFEKYKLLGVFAQDCSKPPKPGDNWYYINRLIDSNHVQHDLMESGTARAKVTIIDDARELRPNEIVVMGTVDNKPATAVWRMAPDKMVQWESSINGELEITGGKRVQTGADMPWITRCGDATVSGGVASNPEPAKPNCSASSPGAGYVYGSYRYTITKQIYPASANIEEAVRQEYGPTATVADWNDLKSFLASRDAVLSFMQSIHLEPQSNNYSCRNYFLKVGGQEFYQRGSGGFTRYFVARHDGARPQDWFIIDGVGQDDLHVGTWNHPSQVLVRVSQ